MSAVLAIAAVAAGVYGVDHMRVGVAQATLQNRVSLAAGETRDQIKHNSRVTMEMTCGDETQTKDLQLDESQMTRAYITTQVPADCEMSDLRLSTFRTIPPEPRQLTLDSPQFTNGTANVAVKQTPAGIEITATGKATAGWFGREITATAQVQVDAAQARQQIQDRLVAVVEGRDEVQVAANEPEAAEPASGGAQGEPQGSAAPKAPEAQKPVVTTTQPAEPANPVNNTPAAPEPAKPEDTTPQVPEPAAPGDTTPAEPAPETPGDATPAEPVPENPGDTTPAQPEPETPGETTPAEPESPGASEEPAPGTEGTPVVEPSEPAPGPEPSEPPADDSQPQTPEELAELWARNLQDHLQELNQGGTPAPAQP